MHGLSALWPIAEYGWSPKKTNSKFTPALYNARARRSHSSHIGDSTSKTMEFASIQAWSSGSSVPTLECHLFDARTNRFCQRKTV